MGRTTRRRRRGHAYHLGWLYAWPLIARVRSHNHHAGHRDDVLPISRLDFEAEERLLADALDQACGRSGDYDSGGARSGGIVGNNGGGDSGGSGGSGDAGVDNGGGRGGGGNSGGGVCLTIRTEVATRSHLRRFATLGCRALHYRCVAALCVSHVVSWLIVTCVAAFFFLLPLHQQNNAKQSHKRACTHAHCTHTVATAWPTASV
jgi:hypothetical protein